MSLIAACRKVFGRTTRFFQGSRTVIVESEPQQVRGHIPEDDSIPGASYDWAAESPDSGRTWYTYLGAAHFLVAYYAAQYTFPYIKDLRQVYPPERRRQHQEMGPYDRGATGDHIQYRLAQQYVRRLWGRGEHTVVQHLRSKGLEAEDVGDEEVEAAWWVLVLRGVVWNMVAGNPGVGSRWRESVPSAFWDMRPPVWVT